MLVRICAWLAFLSLCYAWFVDEAIVPETIAAIVCGALVSVFLTRVESILDERITFPPLGIVRLAQRVPRSLVVESFVVLGPTLFRALCGERRTGGWIEMRFEPERSGEGFGRRTIVIFGTSVTPNAIPLCVDAENERIVLHELVRRPESGTNDPRYPL